MFNLSGNNKGESVKPDTTGQASEKVLQPLNQNLINCPAVLSGMSREMRTQMNSIVAFAYLLNKKEYTDEEKDDFSLQIYNSCQQMICLFDNFLDSAVIDTGNSKTEARICNPDKTFGDLFTEFREELRKDKYKDIILVAENQPLKNGEYLVDANRVTRVIRNLFQNALSNTKSGYIKVGYYVRSGELTFYILDSGEGYSRCREFLQTQDLAESLSKFNDTYSAMNLILTRNLIKMMNGSVWIECNGLKGSGIYFSIPVSTSDVESLPKEYTNSMIAI